MVGPGSVMFPNALMSTGTKTGEGSTNDPACSMNAQSPLPPMKVKIAKPLKTVAQHVRQHVPCMQSQPIKDRTVNGTPASDLLVTVGR